MFIGQIHPGKTGYSHERKASMNFGFSIFLIAVGAILAFALNVHVKGVEIDVVGYILMLVGAVGLVWSAVVYNRRPRYAEEVPPPEAPRREYPPRY